MSLPVRALCLTLCASVVSIVATGCGISTSPTNLVTPFATSVIKGRLHGGQQPVSGSTIQLYAANTTTNQGAATALLAQPAISLSDGSFSITGQYTCPAANPLVYIVATGGNPGLGGSVTNSGIAMMAMLGSCNTLAANAATTFIFIDELTTVVSVEALSPFMSDYRHVGSAPSSLSGVGGAFATATSEVDFTTGQFIGGGVNLSLPEVTINTLANIIAACINSASGSAPCTSLYSNTGGTSDTIAAALQMAKTPAVNAATLYGLIAASAPFQPYFSNVPTDFTTTVGFTVPAFIQTGTLDSNGQIWLYFGGYNYDTATDTSTDSPGYITVYDNNFNQLFTVSPGTGGLNYPSEMTRDASGHVFTLNADNSVSEFASNGAALSPAAGWPTGLSTTFSPTGPGNGYVTNPNQGISLAVDALGNIWGGPAIASQLGKCYFELNSSGANITPSGNFCAASGGTNFSTSAVDGAGGAWVEGTSAITQVNAQGALAATAPISQGCFFPQSSAFTLPNPLLALETATSGLLFDHVHNQLWGYSEVGAGAITNAGAAAFCDFGSTTLPVFQQFTVGNNTPGTQYKSGSLLINSATLDGAGNLWFVGGLVSANGVVGTAAGTFTGTVAYSSYLSEVSPSGTLLTPYTKGTGPYGLQPAGFGPTVNATGTNASVYTGSGGGGSVFLLGVDRFGNIWAADNENNRLMKITGLAVANTVNY